MDESEIIQAIKDLRFAIGPLPIVESNPGSILSSSEMNSIREILKNPTSEQQELYDRVNQLFFIYQSLKPLCDGVEAGFMAEKKKLLRE